MSREKMDESVSLDPDNLATITLGGEPIIQEARQRFDRASEWEAIWRQRFLKDIQFAWGDSENGYQWPNEIRNARDTSARPCLTMNLVRQHNRMISNAARKNKSTVKYVGMGNGATQESANVIRDIHRHVEYQSQAQQAYTNARNWQVDGGRGWWRIATEYADGHSFEQEIKILPVLDPLSIFVDPDCKQIDRSDSLWAFVFDDVPKEELYGAYPWLRGKVAGTQPLGLSTSSGDWLTKHKIRVCEYFRKIPKEFQLVSFVHKGQRLVVKKDHLSRIIKKASVRNELLADPQTRIRDAVEHEVQWYLIVGTEVVDQTIWPGKYIPLVPIVGEEVVINNVYDCKGHTRAMLDAQRMFNYNASAQVEFVALQGKTPWKAPIKAIEEFESIWNTANISNPSVLPYNHVDPENPDQPIPPPERIEPPNVSPGYQLGMETASNHIMLVSGQFQNQMGMVGNERTGAAIQKRQDQSDTATFHFDDNYESGLILTGKMLIDLIPKIYDTKRVKQILADDGEDYELEIDPSARQGYLELQAHDGKVIKRIFNPNIGKFDVAASVGPDQGSKREETREALTLILTQAPALTSIIGDLLLSSMDFEAAQEAAIRLKRMMPPQALGKGPTQNEQAMQAQIQALSAEMVKLLDKNAKNHLKLMGKAELRDIEVYDAETKRMGVLAKMLPEDPEGLRALIEQLVHESLSTGLNAVLKANAPELPEQGSEDPEAAKPPVPGANRAPDGEWYLSDPTRKGKYLHVAAGALAGAPSAPPAAKVVPNG